MALRPFQNRDPDLRFERTQRRFRTIRYHAGRAAGRHWLSHCAVKSEVCLS